MRKGVFFPKLALGNLARNGQFYLPYLLTVAGTSAAYYIVSALAASKELPLMQRYIYLSMFLTIGTFVIALFSILFLTYTNSFLMKRRGRELGVYHILGLGKGHLTLMLGVETVYTALAGIGGGLLLGVLLQKLVTLLLHKIMGFEAYFGFSISWEAVRDTVVLFSLILAGDLSWNVLRMARKSPMELLREGGAGEREPKTNIPAAILGVLTLGGGYAIALCARSPERAFVLYFPAVFLVIAGTYLLFSAVSIAVLKALRRNKRYYYQARHFINVSGMLYRMRRNAVGLANICILSTMVLVMLSGTLSLYLNTRRTLETQFPGNVGLKVRFDPSEETPFDPAAASDAVQIVLRQEGHVPEVVYGYENISFFAVPTETGYDWCSSFQDGAVEVELISLEDYRAIFGQTPGGLVPTRFRFFGEEDGAEAEATVDAAVLEGEVPAVGGAFVSLATRQWLVVEDSAALRAVQAARAQAGGAQTLTWTSFWNTSGGTEEMEVLPQILEQDLNAVLGEAAGSWEWLEADTREDFTQEYYAINGGFFFLGLFLGLIFILAAILIVYYKQLSEGYEDRARYAVMRRVGMEEALVRRCVNGQLLLVFFAPLVVAGVHTAFDHGLMVRLLAMFGLHEPLLTLACTVAVYLTFGLLYALVYRATARAYYKIVGAR